MFRLIKVIGLVFSLIFMVGCAVLENTGVKIGFAVNDTSIGISKAPDSNLLIEIDKQVKE